MVANEYMTRGEMLPSEVVLSLVTKRLEQRDCVQNGWILDGEKKQACDIDAFFFTTVGCLSPGRREATA